MNEKFFELKKEKQDRMINGAMKVFARNGYKRASTDEMVKEAPTESDAAGVDSTEGSVEGVVSGLSVPPQATRDKAITKASKSAMIFFMFITLLK